MKHSVLFHLSRAFTILFSTLALSGGNRIRSFKIVQPIVTEGSSVSLNCEIEESFERQSVTYSITKLEGNGSPLPKINAAHHDGWTSHSAVLSNLTNDEAGCYVCKVTNFDNQVIASERACLFVEEEAIQIVRFKDTAVLDFNENEIVSLFIPLEVMTLDALFLSEINLKVHYQEVSLLKFYSISNPIITRDSVQFSLLINFSNAAIEFTQLFSENITWEVTLFGYTVTKQTAVTIIPKAPPTAQGSLTIGIIFGIIISTTIASLIIILICICCMIGNWKQMKRQLNSAHTAAEGYSVRYSAKRAVSNEYCDKVKLEQHEEQTACSDQITESDITP